MRLIAPLSLLLACLLAAACSHPSREEGPAPAATASSSAEAHSDHSPKHGGIFFMAPDGYHHLEGSYPEDGVVRLHFYDDRTQAMPARYFQATFRLDSAPEGSEMPMVFDQATDTLQGRLDPAPDLPSDVVAFVRFPTAAGAPGPEERFDFRFTRVGGEPVHGGGAHAHASKHGGQVISVGPDHHFELVHHGGMLMLFVLDVAEGTLPVDRMEATLTLLLSGQPPKELSLTKHGTHFMAPSPIRDGDSAVAVATVKMGATTRHGRFTFGPSTAAPAQSTSASAATAAGRFACPMHPEVASDSAGSCPRCGMALVNQP
jgi:hypothetical protein